MLKLQKGVNGKGVGGHIFHFGGPDHKSTILIFLISIGTYDAGRSFEPIFMKFT